MTTFKTKIMHAPDADWQTISSKPHIEVKMGLEQSHYQKNQLLKTAAKPGPNASKKYAGKLSEDGKVSFCNVLNIPGKLFEKNEKLLSFVEHINCS